MKSVENVECCSGSVTIIVPVYNTMNYLDACVQSIIRQTYRNLEIILVDDGATDGSGERCDELSTEDTRVKVVHKQNGGLSSARNVALDMMLGEYVIFIDSDDTVDETIVEVLMTDLLKYKADIVECTLNNVFQNHSMHKNIISKIKCMTVEEALILDLSAQGGSVSACAKLYKKKIFDDYRFREGKLHEDLYAIVDTFSRADNIVFDPRPLYNYHHRRNTITTKGFSKKTLDSLGAAKYTIEKIKQRYPKALQAAYFRYDYNYIYVIDRILLSDDWKKNKYLVSLIHLVRHNWKRIMTCPYYTRNRKIGILILLLSPDIYRRIVIKDANRKWK